MIASKLNLHSRPSTTLQSTIQFELEKDNFQHANQFGAVNKKNILWPVQYKFDHNFSLDSIWKVRIASIGAQ